MGHPAQDLGSGPFGLTQDPTEVLQEFAGKCHLELQELWFTVPFPKPFKQININQIKSTRLLVYNLAWPIHSAAEPVKTEVVHSLITGVCNLNPCDMRTAQLHPRQRSEPARAVSPGQPK